jgi:hypothetical protein
MEKLLTRRDLIIGASAAFTLAGCGGENKVKQEVTYDEKNKEFVSILEGHLGVSDSTNRSELEDLIFERSQDSDFMIDVRNIASFINNRGEEIQFGTNELGWVRFEGDGDLPVFDYGMGEKDLSEKVRDRKQVNILGPLDKVEYYTEDSNLNDMFEFVEGYVGGEDVPFTFTLNMFPLTTDLTLPNLKISFPENYPTGLTFRGEGENGPYYGVVLNLNMAHMQSERLGLDPIQSLREVAVNEAVNLIGKIEADRRNAHFPDNEAPSTLAGYAAAFNPSWDRFFGGAIFTEMMNNWSNDMKELRGGN